MIFLAMFVLLTSTALEFFTVGQSKTHRKLCCMRGPITIGPLTFDRRIIAFTYCAVVSFGLSYVVTLPFEAKGALVMIGGLGSTVLSLAIYQAFGAEDRHKEFIDRYRTDINAGKDMFASLGGGVFLLFRFFTFPFWGHKAIQDWSARNIKPLVRRRE